MSGLLVVRIWNSMGTNQYVLLRAVRTSVNISQVDGGWLREGFWIIITRHIEPCESTSNSFLFYCITVENGSP